jgi:DNA-binding transcriptional regulator/RsmH inhibitor MraZ
LIQTGVLDIEEWGCGGVSDIPRVLRHVVLDERGKIKLPPEFHAFIRQGGQTVFVTMLEKGILRVYPLPAWDKQCAALFAAGTELAESLYFLSQDQGRDSTVDKNSRLTLHPDLLTLFGGGNQTVVLQYFRDRINIYNQAAYLQQQERAATLDRDGLMSLKRAGILL